MTRIETKDLLKEFKAYTKEINSTKESATEFYIKVGINTPTGRLKKDYYHQPNKIGYKK